MDSINQQQPEHNREDLTGRGAVEQIQAIAKQGTTCFFCTAARTGDSDGIRPMSVQDVDDEGNLWSLSASDSHLNREITVNALVRLLFQGSAHSDFMHLNGTASIVYDRAKIDEFWNPVFNTWFTKGKDDPRITVIKVEPTDGYYWDSKHGHLVAGAKMLVGAFVGKTLDDSIEGRLRV
jgi:general stress protein 26